ncbi:cytochrome oxidase small assembly protein [Massilia jejuensis]|uniref:Cytochrome oxidase small assembly protein n=1 Tax=Massilia jejuensis TaxID=648894 RepID=A0ABW0PN91_9BURK
MNAPKKPGNVKTALILCVIAAFFFAAVIIKRTWFMS